MFRTLPPTAAPIKLRVLLSSFSASLGREDAEKKFKDQIKNYFGSKHAFLVSSGKAAIYLTLQSLAQQSKRREVVIPAYSSFCLASAVARTGLSVKLCDLDPNLLDFDLSALRSAVNENTLAVIPVHNFGLVCYLPEIQKIASVVGAYVLEDAAQAAGAMLGDRKAGAIGDVGILSLGRGKNICTLGGGVILTNHARVAELIAERLSRLSSPSFFSQATNWGQGLALSLLLNPKRYAIPARLPFSDIGRNIFDPAFPVERFAKFKAEIGQKIFHCLDEYNAIRIRHASSLQDGLRSNGSISIPRPNPGGQSVYLRFPVLFPRRELRQETYRLLKQKGLGANPSYPWLLGQIEGFRKYLAVEKGYYPGASSLADRLLTLPTHSFVKNFDIHLMVGVVNQLTNG
jgi:perosamine synthetase